MARDMAGGAVQVFSGGLWFLGFMGLTRRVGHSYPKAAAWIAFVAALGATGTVAYGIDSIHRVASGVRAQELGPTGMVATMVPGTMFPLALMCFGVALLRSGTTPRWSAALLILGGVLFPISRIAAITPLALGVDVVLLLAAGPIGWAMLTADGARVGGVRGPTQAGSVTEHAL
jgi:hypothetical protein